MDKFGFSDTRTLRGRGKENDMIESGDIELGCSRSNIFRRLESEVETPP